MKTRIAKLVPPHLDKHWSFQMVNPTEEEVGVIRAAFHVSAVKAANPFLQGCSKDWLMVEFWTDSKDEVDAASAHLFNLVSLPVLEGDFTRAELGLE
ncbi:hypothetical protein KTD31_01010 [Burkholderia multivorans]|uniref:hypothetical protein n=1 Tax=Burkholderia multivorans TaxID=87883 RepID=UPI001C2224C1|nr:hypothetical protein [Burkholderia multivorans]MBU9199981.1 hypothetical protein [Burkholderia multivorans]MDN8078900.1 hypothetical protein [Burkholderia multivorans]